MKNKRCIKYRQLFFIIKKNDKKHKASTETFQPILKEKLFINADCNISDFIGAIVRFTVSRSKREFNQNNAELERFLAIIEKHEIEGYDRKKFFKEEKMNFYDDNKLYIYKSNKPKDWTELMAINDANEEIEAFFQALRST